MGEHYHSSSGGIGFVGILTIVFIVLKLTKYIAWSWFWVLSPLLISVALGLIVIFFMILFAFIWRKK